MVNRWPYSIKQVLERIVIPPIPLLRFHTMPSTLPGRYRAQEASFSTFHGNESDVVVKVPLAQSLASIVVEECKVIDKPQITRVDMKRMIEMRVKKRVKQHYVDGKFHDLFRKVVADPRTLVDACNSLRVCSNVVVGLSENTEICFDSFSEELVNGMFDVKANTFTVSTKGHDEKQVLVLPSFKLKIVQEAIRIVLEVVFRPHFSKISHGGRSGRGRLSALKYIRKEIGKPDWWFTVLPNKKLDSPMLAKLILTIEDKINDPQLSGMIQRMFDAQALNLEFGGFPKGQGLPQEGVLSPILMNIYLDLFDDEFHKVSLRYEALDSCSSADEKPLQSKLRDWFRRQIRSSSDKIVGLKVSGVRVHCCRFMDEIFFAVTGPIDTASSLKSEVLNYLHDCLLLDTHNSCEITPCNHRHGIRFCGVSVVEVQKDSPAVRAIHKLKEKVTLFALQKQEVWDAGTIRIGKKWLGHGVKKVKESEIRHLSENNLLLSKISHYRKPGMETDHWYKHLLKIWMMQEVKGKAAINEEFILSKCIAELSLPPTLRDSFYEFQRQVEKYSSSETETLLSLLPPSDMSQECLTMTKILAPVQLIKKRLMRYGIVNARGYGCAVQALILQDKCQIIDWFSGIVSRWVKWLGDCENFGEIRLIILNKVRMSCIRTLALKYRIHESEIEKRFESELSRIPLSHDLEGDVSENSVDSFSFGYDEGLMYGITYSGVCQLSLARLVSVSRPCNCFVFGCNASAPCVYTLHVMERQKFPGWNTGFSSCIHPSLNRRRIGLCRQHLKDLYLGDISLQCIDFGSWK
ncbi:nuclear intron maturase 4, mitochondrial [Silene latifolia]|uniref:nuclear intron maturase 4, mitochondrial n=1 Tax=Silene latifolia TaxID=37657 RepID=UPI003D785610